MFPKVIEGVRYELFTMAHAEGVTKVITEAFTKYEPMTVEQNIPEEAFIHFFQKLLPKAEAEGLTTVAIDEASGEVVGAMVSDDIGEPPPCDFEDIHEGFGPIFTLLEKLDNWYLENRPEPKPGEYAHFFMIGTLVGYKTRNIGFHLLDLAVANAKARGYKYGLAEVTGRISQHLFINRCGFVRHHEIFYRDYEFNGQRVFASISDHPSSMLVARDL